MVGLPESLRWIDGRANQRPPDPNVSASPPSPNFPGDQVSHIKALSAEVILLSPKHKQAYYWVPMQDIQISQGLEIPKSISYPKFRIINLTEKVITDINLALKIIDTSPIKSVFIESQHFKSFGAKIEPASIVPFQLSNTKGQGSEFLAADEETINLPFLKPSSSPDDAEEFLLPSSIANSYAIRLIATSPRPNPNNMPSEGGGILKISGPPIEVTMRYRQGDTDNVHLFRIESTVLLISETSWLRELGGTIPTTFWSPHNLRAWVTFSVVQNIKKQ